MNLIKSHLKIIIFLIFSAQANADVQPADNDKIISLMKQGVPLIDIRTNSEWQNTGIIKNSKLLTFFDRDGKSDVKSWMNKLREMAKKDQPLIIICRSGRRSGIVSDMLVNEENYSEVYNANSGIMAWINSGLETTKEGLINEN
tara:strand:+ start:886 stop:1317 length:432 start_codon:yes stop_codon:yes gene_type:complete